MKLVEYCENNSISDPTEILREAQKVIVQAGKLDSTSTSDCLEGATNFTLVDRLNVLTSAFEELGSIENPRLTLEVSFYGERAQDLGGPRKEFFRLCVGAIKAKYFDNNPMMHLSLDYRMAGLIIALSILQNRVIPRFFPEETLTEIFFPNEMLTGNEENICITSFREGLPRLGLLDLSSFVGQCHSYCICFAHSHQGNQATSYY